MNTEFLKQYFTLSEPSFLNENYQLRLTAQSKELFEMGKPGQAYIGLVDLETHEIHLYPAFNKNDGLERVDKHGGNFNAQGTDYKRYVESKDSLGSRTGDLHEKAVSELGLVGKSGSRKMIMGFGLWKAGVSVKFVNALPPPIALIPHEIYVVKSSDGWQIYKTDKEGSVIPLHIPDQLLAVLNTEPQDKKLIEEIIRSHYIPPDYNAGDGIKYAKNRSTSQNSYSCVYSDEYKVFFKSRTRRHAVHERDLEREQPFPVFQKIFSVIGDELNMPSCKQMARTSLEGNPMIPHGVDDIQFHFDLESDWKDVIQEIEKSNIDRVSKENQGQLLKLIFSLPNIMSSTIEQVIRDFKDYTLTDTDIEKIKNFIGERYDYSKMYNYRQVSELLDFLNGIKLQNNDLSFATIMDELNKTNQGALPNLQSNPTLLRALIKYRITDVALNLIEICDAGELTARLPGEESVLLMAMRHDQYDVALKILERNNQVSTAEVTWLLNDYLKIGSQLDQKRLDMIAKMMEVWSDSFDNELIKMVLEQCATTGNLFGRPERVVDLLKGKFDLSNPSPNNQELLEFYCATCEKNNIPPSPEILEIFSPKPVVKVVKDIKSIFDKEAGDAPNYLAEAMNAYSKMGDAKDMMAKWKKLLADPLKHPESSGADIPSADASGEIDHFKGMVNDFKEYRSATSSSPDEPADPDQDDDEAGTRHQSFHKK